MGRWLTTRRSGGEPARAERGSSPRASAATLVALCLALPATGQEDRLDFARHGRDVASLSPDALAAAAAARSLVVFEPYEARQVEFRVWPLNAILDAVYGPGWRHEDELLFSCRDGYQPSVPVSRLLAHDAYLAFERPGARDFGIDKRESGRLQRVSLAPFYVVWDNLDDEQLRREHDYGWPYQLVGIELIDAAQRFPALRPPAGAGSEARAGLRAFRMHCSRCHALNGVGGSIGPELNDRPRPVGSRDPAWLRRWIDDPASYSATARMPALNPALPDRAATLDRLVAYLQAMAQAPAP